MGRLKKHRPTRVNQKFAGGALEMKYSEPPAYKQIIKHFYFKLQIVHLVLIK